MMANFWYLIIASTKNAKQEKEGVDDKERTEVTQEH